MITIYGISNCDKCRAALKWFAQQGLEHSFHDVRKDGLTATQVKGWLQQADISELLNKRSTTWRECSSAERDTLLGPAPSAVILERPTVLKRPLVSNGAMLLIGYDEDQWQTHFTRNGTRT